MGKSKLFSYYVGNMNKLIKASALSGNTLIKSQLSMASSNLVKMLGDMGAIVDESYRHVIDNNAIRHILKTHGGKSEILRGQIPITQRDMYRIPTIISEYDTINIDNNRRGQTLVIYTKTFDDGVLFYVEEIRLGRRELAASTLYKRKKEDSPTLIE